MGGHLSASHSFIHLLLGKHLLYARHCPRGCPYTNEQPDSNGVVLDGGGHREKHQWGGRWRGAVMQEGLTEEVAFEQNPGGGCE
jgi:hypothetical protein